MTFTDHMMVWNGLKPDLDGAYDSYSAFIPKVFLFI